jgi:glutaredoxin
MKKSHALFILGVALFALLAAGNRPAFASEAVIHLFWVDGCPHCVDAKAFLETLEKRYPQIDVKKYEMSADEANEKLLQDILSLYGIRRQTYPAIFIGDLDPVMGYHTDSTTGAEIEEKVQYCLKNRCGDPIGRYLAAGERGDGILGAGGENPADGAAGDPALPFMKNLNSSRAALPLFTLVIALLDSVNPCAFFVLTFLLSLLTHLASAKKILVVGGTFVFFSAAIYFVFMAAWFNLFYLTRTLRIVTVAAGAVAVCMSLLNIKDFLFFKSGVSLSIPDGKRNALIARMRTITLSGRTPAMAGGAALLAIGANFYEMLCTAGFPMVYTKMLTLRKMGLAAYYLYLLMYNVIYIVPLAAIVVVFAVTLGSRKMTEWQGRVLKLSSGLMMISLGVVLIVDPSVLNSVTYSVLIVGGAVALSLLAAFIVKKRLDIGVKTRS